MLCCHICGACEPGKAPSWTIQKSGHSFVCFDNSPSPTAPGCWFVCLQEGSDEEGDGDEDEGDDGSSDDAEVGGAAVGGQQQQTELFKTLPICRLARCALRCS